MQELTSFMDRCLAQQDPVALATVIRTWGSAPRGAGAKMAISAKGEMAGSVSGGCVEGAVVEAGLETLKTGVPQRLHFGVADETAWEVGLACGGQIDIFVQPLDDAFFREIRERLERGQPVTRILVSQGPAEWVGCEFLKAGDEFVFGKFAYSHKAQMKHLGRRVEPANASQVVVLNTARPEPIELFVDVILPPPVLVIVGGVHIAIPLVTLANALGYATILVDPRKKFGSPARFPHADRIINLWPDAALEEIGLSASTAVAILTHDPKIDDPALLAALPSGAFYVGALGSLGTQKKRRARLLEMGLSPAQIQRLRGPIGLDLGGQSPEEIALAIMAEIVQARNRP